MAEKKTPCCPDKVNLLIQSDNAPWQETDREWLESLEEPQIDKLVDQEKLLAQRDSDLEEANKKATEAEEKALQANKTQLTEKEIVQILRKQCSTTEQFLELAPEPIRGTLMTAHREQQTKIAAMIKDIVENSTFTKEELEGKKVEELDKIARMIPQRADYSGQQAGGETPTREDAPEDILLPSGVEKLDGKGEKVNG